MNDMRVGKGSILSVMGAGAMVLAVAGGAWQAWAARRCGPPETGEHRREGRQRRRQFRYHPLLISRWAMAP